VSAAAGLRDHQDLRDPKELKVTQALKVLPVPQERAAQVPVLKGPQVFPVLKVLLAVPELRASLAQWDLPGLLEMPLSRWVPPLMGREAIPEPQVVRGHQVFTVFPAVQASQALWVIQDLRAT
jgi:hypothetical protein